MKGEISKEPELWRLGLEWLRGANERSVHPLDQRRVRLVARGMRMVGESPPPSEVNREIAALWGRGRLEARMTREIWRSVFRVESSIGRSTAWDTPLVHPDVLIERHGLRPSTEERLESVALRAIERFSQAASSPDSEGHVRAKRGVLDAMQAFQHLRYLRFGPQSLGIRGFDPEQPLRPHRRPAG